MAGGRTPSELYAERAKRIEDASTLKEPDRVPLSMAAGYLIAEYGGVSHQEVQDNPRTAQELTERFALEFEPDCISGVWMKPGPGPALGDRMTAFPGYGLPASGSFQFRENEFMKADDYDAFLLDPSDWIIRTYLPRAFAELEGLALLPPIGNWANGFFNLPALAVWAAPPLQRATQALAKAVQIAVAEQAIVGESSARLAALGFPPPFVMAAFASAPFDYLSDTLRGMRGIMLDMMRQPEKVLAAEEKALRIQLDQALSFSRATGGKQAFLALHRGSDGFMSIEQFKTFYWPQLRSLICSLADAGLRCHVFFEGCWDNRLEYLRELPRGAVQGYFQKSDLAMVKEVLGDHMCIVGGMPNSLLMGGTVSEIRERTHGLCEVVGKGGGYIMSTSVGEMEGCDLALVRAWVDATREFGTYQK